MGAALESLAEEALAPEQLSHLRHDLRTPINQIIGYGEMVLEDAENAGHEEVATKLCEIRALAGNVLEKQNVYLLVDSKQVTESYLVQMCSEVAPLSLRMAQLIRELAQLSAGPDFSYCKDTVPRLDKAAQNLIDLLPRCGRVANPTNVSAVIEKGANGHIVRSMAEEIAPASSDAGRFNLLVVDDNEENRTMLSRRLVREGYSVVACSSGSEALDLLARHPFDLLLLDVLMEGMNGYEVLEKVKSNQALRDMPVIMISALDQIESVVRCMEMGAEDYLPKPFNPVLLRARIGVTLERKRLRDEERGQKQALERTLNELEGQKRVAEDMLLNILPAKVAHDLQEHGVVAPMYFEDVTIGFTDFVGFTLATEKLAAEEVVSELNSHFTAFDEIVARYGLEKLKTIGDSYMFVSGLPTRRPSNPINAVMAALEMLESVKRRATSDLGVEWHVRIGLHTGPVIAGVVGIRKFAFDIWGDAVNFASRMESSSEPGRINISERTYGRVKDFFSCQHRGRIETKDHREVDMYFVNGVQERLLVDQTSSPPPLFRRRFQLYFQEDPPAFPDFLLRNVSNSRGLEAPLP